MELKLTNVAKASLEELRLDYEDFLRQRRLPQWERPDRRRQELVARRCRTADEVARWVREVWERERRGLGGPCGPGGLSNHAGEARASAGSARSTRSTETAPYAAIAANAALTLVAVATALLGRQIEAQAAAFEREGGFTERLYRRRQERRRER